MQQAYWRRGAGSRLEAFPLLLGRDIFEHRSSTGLNRSPIDDLVSIILSGIELEDEFPTDITDATIMSTVDGSGVLVNPPGFAATGAYWLADVFCPDPVTIYQYHRAADGDISLVAPNDNLNRVYSLPTMSKWTQTEKSWVETVYNYSNYPNIEEKRGQTVPAASMVAFPNGRGILYWAQDAWWRMEELSETERQVNGGVNLLPVFEGNVGSQDDFTASIIGATLAIVVPRGVNIHRPISNQTIDQLLSVYKDRRQDWLYALNAIEAGDPDRPVARHTELQMQAMKMFCLRIRGQLKKIYALWSVELNFDQIVIQPPSERLIEAQLIDMVNPTDRQERKERLLA